MSIVLPGWSFFLARILLGLVMACATYGLLRGPRAQDGVLGLDTLHGNATMLLLTFDMRSGSTLYFEAALIIALWGSSQRRRWRNS
jgi:multicomponent K+:H+ antiporter subunit F